MSEIKPILDTLPVVGGVGCIALFALVGGLIAETVEYVRGEPLLVLSLSGPGPDPQFREAALQSLGRAA